MFTQVNAQSNVNTSLFTITPASIGSQQRVQTFSKSQNPMATCNKIGQQGAKYSIPRPSVTMSASNQNGADQSAPNKFVQSMQQVVSNVSNEFGMALNPRQPYMQLATNAGSFQFDSNIARNMQNFNQMKSMKPGGNMNQTGVAQSQFTVKHFPSRSNVKMQATTEAYATDLDSFLSNKPQEHAVIDNIDEKGDVPNNTYKPKDPYVGKVIFNETLTGPDAGEVCHIAFDHQGKLPYAEGQSIGIIAKGQQENGKPHKLRLYSIASSAPGDYGDGKTVSLCVKRLIYEDEDGKEVKGVCSNYICDLKPGDEVMITGPVGKALLLPKDEKANVIMLATGTGIAPFRSFLWRFFMEKHPDYKFDGNAWLFLGVPTTTALLYDNEFKKMKEIGGDKFRYDYAISREQKNAAGDKMYIQTRMAEYGEELWEKLQLPNTYLYMCGLKGMESGIQEALGGFAEKNGVDWKDFVKGLKKEGRYHVEVY